MDLEAPCNLIAQAPAALTSREGKLLLLKYYKRPWKRVSWGRPCRKFTACFGLGNTENGSKMAPIFCSCNHHSLTARIWVWRRKKLNSWIIINILGIILLSCTILYWLSKPAHSVLLFDWLINYYLSTYILFKPDFASIAKPTSSGRSQKVRDADFWPGS